MKKRIISVILCLSILATALMVSVSAVADITAETVVIEDNSSMTLLAPNNGGEYRVYFGDVFENSTLTWYVKPGDAYADDQEAFYYKLFSGDTFLGGFESNPFGANGTRLHMNTTQAGQNHAWSGYNGANSAAYNLNDWNRLDLVVDFTNKQISGYVNYNLVQTLSFSASGLTSFDHLKIGGYRNGYRGTQRIYVDNLVLTKGANAPTAGDFAAAVAPERYESNKDNVLMCETFNADAPIVHGFYSNITAFEPGKIYHLRTNDPNNDFCRIDNTVGMKKIELPTGTIPEYRGVQESRVDDKDDWTFNVRFVATVNEINDMSMLGFDITCNGKTKTIVCEKVYSEITGSKSTGIDIKYSALTDLGSNYIYAVTLKGLSSKLIYDFKITPFVFDKNYTKTVGETARVVYTTGLLTENSFDTEAPVKADVGTVMNVDGDAVYYIYNNYIVKGGKNLQDIGFWAKDWFDYYYKDCGISDMIYCLSSTVPSDRYEDKVDKYLKKTDNGVAVDYTGNLNYKASYEIYTKTNVDPYQVWFDQCREYGINPWISYRMNDVHGANEELGHDDFFYTAKANGWLIGNSRWNYWSTNNCTIGSRYWYAYAYNYQIPQVRDFFLDKIDAQLDMYDPYGIELDWQRQMWCFPTDDLNNMQYMNIMLEEINKIVEKYEKKYGHDIKVAIRLNRDIDEAKYFGFDVLNFAQQGWIDVVIPSSYWGSTDNDMPIAEWVERLDGTGVKVWAGLECHIMNNSYWQTVGSLAGYTAQYLSQGAEKIYHYNTFGYGGKMTNRVCASIEMAQAAQRRAYIVTESNCTPYNVGFTQYDPLPMKLSAGGSGSVTINHGALIENNQTMIFVAASGSAPTVTYNGASCTYLGTTTNSTAHVSSASAAATLGTMYLYAVPAWAVAGATSGTVTVSSSSSNTINYIELMN